MHAETGEPEGVDHVAALDVGGTLIKAALIGRDGHILYAIRRPTGRERGAAAVLSGILDLAEELHREGLRRLGRPPRAVGLASPGLVDEDRGISVLSANVGWRDVPIRARLADRLGIPVSLTHDVRAGALAEATLGAGRARPSFLFLPIGTGIGGAFVVDGRVISGAHYRAGEVGHLPADPNGQPCGCGGRGCLETVASASAIARAYAERGGQPIAADEVAARAAAGESLAEEVWTHAVDALAAGIMMCSTLLDPGLVVVGGGLAKAGEILFGPLRDAMARRVTFQVLPSLVAARLGDEAGCQGAGLCAWNLATDNRADNRVDNREAAS